MRAADGISAALAVLHLTAAAWAGGESLQDAYDALEVEHGVHLTAQLTLPVAATVDVMSRLRAPGLAELGGQPVTSVTDYSGGWDLPSADMLSYHLPGARVVVRPDGSEPEITAYLEVVAPVPAGGLQYARDNAANRMAALSQAVRTLLDS